MIAYAACLDAYTFNNVCTFRRLMTFTSGTERLKRLIYIMPAIDTTTTQMNDTGRVVIFVIGTHAIELRTCAYVYNVRLALTV